MDKDKNRNDLLAVGRKKLQQFRKKKETKGKSSHKAGKSKTEGDAGQDPPASPKRDETSHSLDPQSVEKSVDIGADSAKTDVSEASVVVPGQEVVLERVASLKGEEQLADVNSSVQQDAGSVETEKARVVENVEEREGEVAVNLIDTSDKSAAVSGELTHAAVSESVDSLASPASVLRNNQVEEKRTPLLQEVSSDMSSSKEMENQEADSLGPVHCDGRGQELHSSLQDDENVHVNSISLEPEGSRESEHTKVGDDAEQSHDPEETEKVSCKTEAFIKDDDSVISINYTVEGILDEASGSVSAEASDEVQGTDAKKFEMGTGGTNYREEGSNMEDVIVCADENDSVAHSATSVTISREEGNPHIGPGEDTEETIPRAFLEKETVSQAVIQTDVQQGRSVDELLEQPLSSEEAVLVFDRPEKPLEASPTSYGSKSDSFTKTSSIDLNQLVNVILGLDDEEIRHLCKVSSLTSKLESENIIMPEQGFSDVVESLKQQLYSTIVAKDFFQLQLSEQNDLQLIFDQRDSQLRDEVAKLNSTLQVTQECNTNLSEELAQCRYDLHLMAARREELETQFTGVREELVQCRSDLEATSSAKEELEKEFTGAKEELAQSRSDLSTMAAGKEELETQLSGASEELAQYRYDLQAMEAGKKELEALLSSAREELAQCRSDLQAMASGREDLEVLFIGAKEELAQSKYDFTTLEAVEEELESQLSGSKEELAQCRSDLEAMANRREELETLFTATREELARCRADLSISAAGREELEAQLAGTGEELAQSRSDLHAMAAEREELEVHFAKAREESTQITTKSLELQTQLERSHEEMASLLEQLAGMRDSVKSLETEKSKLHNNLTEVIGEREKLEVEINHFQQENQSLAAQLLEHQEYVSNIDDKPTQLQDDLKEAMVRLEQLTHENIFLSSSLDVHKAKLKEIESEHSHLLSHIAEAKHQSDGLESPIVQFDPNGEGLHGSPRQVVGKDIPGVEENLAVSFAEGKPAQSLKGEGSIIAIGFSDLKELFDEAEKTVQKVEKEIEKMHLHSVSLSKSGGKVAGVGVSKLIQAFELKVHDENGPVELPLDDAQKPTEDHLTLTKEQMSNLRTVLKKLDLSALKVIEEFKQEKSNSKRAFVALSELQILHESSKQHSNNFEAKVNELVEKLFTYQSRTDDMHLQLYTMQQKSDEMDALFFNQLENLQKEASKQQNTDLETQITELVKKLSEYQSRTDDMHLKLYTMQQKSDEMEALFFSQLENLQKDVSAKLSVLEQEWTFTITEVSDSVENLNSSIAKMQTVPYSTLQSENVNVGCHIAASVKAATNVVEDLHEKLGTAYSSLMKMHNSYETLCEKFSDLHVRNGLAVEILHMIYSELEKFTGNLFENIQGAGPGTNNENLVDLLNPSNYMYYFSQLSKLLEEGLQLNLAKADLEEDLLNRKQEVVELKKTCIGSNSILKLVEDVKSVVKFNDVKIDFDETDHEPSVLHLESLIAVLVQQYKQASEQVSSSKEESGMKAIEYNELKEKIDQLSSLSSQQEDENHTLKKRLKEVDATLEALRSDLQVKEAELEKVHQFSSLSTQQEDENHILKERLKEVETTLEALRSDLQVKEAELQQSEHRVSSVREKLSIAVAKGKGLIVQRDNLKQSLSEMSSELERSSQEVQSKDTRLQEVEAKLTAYSEAGERMEALESELSYIRNSATALRESFLLKDSILQRIEEVLEELELPEHFHSRDIIEKVEWLVRSISRNSQPMNDWDQRNSVGGGSYSDSGFVDMDGWKEDSHPISNPGSEDLNRKYKELQRRFYVLAEQNEMLEQSLMERNRVIQTWEEALDRLGMPSQFQSMEIEERIESLGNALSDAQDEREFFQNKIEDFENHCRSLTIDLEQSLRKISDLELALQGVTHERELLSERFENLLCDQEKVVEKVSEYELENGNLQNEVATLREELVKKVDSDDHYHHVEDELKRLQVLVIDALQDQCTDYTTFEGSGTKYLEELLRKLLENYIVLSFEKSVFKDVVKEFFVAASDVVYDESKEVVALKSEDVALKSKDQDQVISKEEFEELSSNLAFEKAEREKILATYQSVVVEVEELGRQRDVLQEKLNQEEVRLTSTRDKLNVAVRRGKGLVQQRDSLKQTIDEMKTDMDILKNELNQKESALAQYQQKIGDLATFPEKVEILERECLFLRNRLAEMEHNVRDSGDTLSTLTDTLNAIDIGSGLNALDPIQKMKAIGKQWSDLQAALISSEHESKKSKRATELLLAELNEVHERADGLQEELSKAETALSGISKERDLAVAAKNEALARLEKLFNVRSEERKKELEEVYKFKSFIDQLRKGCFGINNLLANVFSVELELLNNVENGMEYLRKQRDTSNVVNPPLLLEPCGVLLTNTANEVKFHTTTDTLEMKIAEDFDGYSVTDVLGSVGRTLKECVREVDTIREKCHGHSLSREDRAKRISKAMDSVHQELTSWKNSWESTKRDVTYFELMREEKDKEILMTRRMIARLQKACLSSVMEIANQKAQMVPDDAHNKKGIDMKFPVFPGGQEIIDGEACFTEESVADAANSLLLAVSDLASIQTEILKNSEKEFKITISKLQNEVQESDIQKNRICAELVNQIKKAEAVASNHLVDLQNANTKVEQLEKQIEALEMDRKALELRINDLQDAETSSVQLQERIASLTDLLSAKGQEVEDLMQALDEEESQMEGLRSKIEELDKLLQQKNLEMENLEASRGKAMSKLYTTVNKFDELHQLSESLLSEIENLQLQLQGRDEEISFLRQEVTRCTKDVLAASQESNERNSTEMQDLLKWLDMMTSRFEGYCYDVKLDKRGSSLEACKDILENQITYLLSELETLRSVARRKDILLQTEKDGTGEQSNNSGSLERFLHEKEPKIASRQGSRDMGDIMNLNSSDISEVEPMINKRTVAGISATPHVRSMRKLNSDQVAISIDEDPSTNTLDDEDDKVHGFKSLTTSKLVPRFTRPVSDMIDGLWVSCDRALMRQPALRLGIIIYWFMLHTLLATAMV